MSSRQPSSWTLPDPPTCDLSNMTLMVFCDAFCMKNGLTGRTENQGSQPWDVILQAYKHYVQRYYGLNTLHHISMALSRTKANVPEGLIQASTRQLLLDDMLKKTSNNIRDPQGSRKRALDMEDGEISSPEAKQVKIEVIYNHLIQKAVI